MLRRETTVQTYIILDGALILSIFLYFLLDTVAYKLRMPDIPGKFDTDKAEKLGIPKGKLWGMFPQMQMCIYCFRYYFTGFIMCFMQILLSTGM
jgi:hypothetical protein